MMGANTTVAVLLSCSDCNPAAAAIGAEAVMDTSDESVLGETLARAAETGCPSCGAPLGDGRDNPALVVRRKGRGLPGEASPGEGRPGFTATMLGRADGSAPG